MRRLYLVQIRHLFTQKLQAFEHLAQISKGSQICAVDQTCARKYRQPFSLKRLTEGLMADITEGCAFYEKMSELFL